MVLTSFLLFLIFFNWQFLKNLRYSPTNSLVFIVKRDALLVDIVFSSSLIEQKILWNFLVSLKTINSFVYEVIAKQFFP